MFKKSLLIMMLLAVFAPWEAEAQTVTVCDGTDNSQYVPFDGYNADSQQHNQMIFPATDLTAMNGKEITQMVFYIDQSANNGTNTAASRLGTWTVSLGETTATTLSGLDNTTALTQVYQGYFDCSTGTLTLAFSSNYVYHGGNLLVDLNHAASKWNTWYFLGVNQTENTAITRGSLYKFLPKTTFSYQTPPTCPAPGLAAAQDITDSQASFSWTENGSATNWVLQYSTSEEFTNATSVNVQDTPAKAINNFQPLSTYYVRVKADCGEGDQSQWSNVISFSTTAVAQNVGDAWSDDFEGTTCGWELINGTITNAWAWGTATNNGGTHALYVSNDGGNTNAYTVGSAAMVYATKLLTFADGKYEFSYDWNGNGESTWDYMRVALVPASVTLTAGTIPSGFSDSALPSGWIAVDGGSKLNLATAWQSMSAAVNVTAGNYYMVLAWRNDNSDGINPPAAVDNVSITKIACDQDVTDLAVSEITTSSATLSWNGGEATQWQVAYSTASNFEGATEEIVSNASFDMSGLQSSSTYFVKVRAYCGGEDFGSWCQAISFATACGAITTFPWSEDFENYNSGDFNAPCWVNEHISGNGTQIFKVNTSTTGNNSTHQLQLPDMQSGTMTKLMLPEMTLPGDDHLFSIDVYRNATSNAEEGIRVFASTDGEIEGATELAFISRNYTVTNGVIPAETASDWYTYELPIGFSGTCYIILRGESRYGSSTYMDNLTVEQIPTCARPSELASSNVTNHSATIEWTAGDTEQTLWQIAYSKTNFDPNTANFDVTTVTTIDAIAHPFTLDKILDAESTYYVYVRANCGTAAEPDFGPWSRKGINFTTLAATPAPSNFVATNPASAMVDLVWNAGGGDFESWELYYVASDDAPEAPTATTQASVSDITTLPTTEAPYVLEGLNPVTKYYAWIRAKHVWNNEATYSDWVALTSNYFETLDACPTPTDLVATNLTSVSADLSWVGSDDVDNYTVEYGEEGTYSMNETEDFSAYTATTYDAAGSLPEDWYGYSSGSYKPHVSNNSVLGGSYDLEGFAGGSGSTNNFIYMIGNGTSPNTSYTILPQFSDVMAISFDYGMESESNGTLTVGYCTDNTSGSTFVAFTDLALANSKNSVSVNLTSADIALLNDNHGYLTFCWTYDGNYGVGIDIVTIKGGTYTPGATQTIQAEGTSITISNLTPNKTYIVKVKSNCTNGEYCEPITFTTLAEGNMVFTNATNDGKWRTAGNWTPAQMPVLTDEVILRANATIESGCVAEANKINLNSNTLTIADGGQLITNTEVAATVQKVINAHGATVEEGGWNFIASPINSSLLTPTSVGLNLITDNYEATIPEGQSATYDLYSFLQNPALDENGVGNEWRNYRKNMFYLANGKGYLYASLEGTTLNFTGSIKAATTSGAVSLTYADESTTQDMTFRGWNLVGNPFTFDTYVNMSYYKMNEDGSAVEPVDAYQTTTITPCTGIMVQATATGQSVTFSKDAPSSQNGNQGNLNIALVQANVRNNAVMDKAILSFNEGSQLSKFYFGQSKANIYFPQFNEELAIVQSEGMGEMPLSFRANESGTYTLSFNAEEVTFSYLHLIDNMTGMDVDLLQTPSYTFDARTTDYSSRFKLVFATGSNNDSDNFAFFSNGTWVISNDGEATLQVIDVTGRVLCSETVNGSVSKAINASAGVYMLRLINGNDVRTQKIVVR